MSKFSSKVASLASASEKSEKEFEDFKWEDTSKVEDEIKKLQKKLEEKRSGNSKNFKVFYSAKEDAKKNLNHQMAKEIAAYMMKTPGENLKNRIFLALKYFGPVNRYVLTDAVKIFSKKHPKNYKETTIKTVISSAYTDGAYKHIFKTNEEEKEISAK